MLAHLSFLLFSCSDAHRDLHSFPTRRSSDLTIRLPYRRSNPSPSPRRRLTWSPTESASGESSSCARVTRSGRISRLTRPKDRKSTRLNSSHTVISYAVFCLKKKNKEDAIRSL